MYQKNRKEAHGGGVCIYVCESMMSVEVCDLSLCSKEVEVVWCEIRCGMDRVLVGCFLEILELLKAKAARYAGLLEMLKTRSKEINTQYS